MFIRTLLILQDNEDEQIFQNYIESLYNNGIKVGDILKPLQDKGIILKSYKIPNPGESFNPYSIPIAKNVLKTFYRSSFELGRELFENYPQFTTINGNLVPIRTVAKHFDSLEDCFARYGKCIRNNPEIHKEIIELLKWAKEHDIICCSLSSFVINNGWHDLKSLKEDGGVANINYDAIKML